MPYLLSNILMAVDLINFDPDILSVFVSFFAVGAKYGFFFGIFYVLVKMITRAATGKERFW